MAKLSQCIALDVVVEQGMILSPIIVMLFAWMKRSVTGIALTLNKELV